jgi:tetrahydromethanopterin S-methyltransferase subunit G
LGFLDTLSVEQKITVHKRYIKIASSQTFSWSSYHQASGKKQSRSISIYSGGCISLAMPFYEITAMHLLLAEGFQLQYVKMFENL